MLQPTGLPSFFLELRNMLVNKGHNFSDIFCLLGLKMAHKCHEQNNNVRGSSVHELVVRGRISAESIVQHRGIDHAHFNKLYLL